FLRPLGLRLAARAQAVPAAPPALAQPAVRVTLQGVAWDSLSGAPLVGALVQFAHETEPSRPARTAVSDSLGRWRIDTMPSGPYIGGFFHPTLDALGLEPPTFRALIAGDSTARLDLGIPGPSRMRALLCGAAAGDSTGGIIGTLRDATSQEPLAGATLSVGWREVVIARGSIRSERRRVPVVARSTGTFLACGVPTDTPVELDAVAPGRASGVVEVRVPVGAVVRRDMLLGDSATLVAVARAAAAPPSDSTGAAPVGLRVAGGATLRGTVTTPNGEPLARAQVALAGTGRTATTSTGGAFVLDSLPGGTFGLEARAVGYAPVSTPVDLGPGRTTNVRLAFGERAQQLSSVVVRGKRTRASSFLEDFAARRRRSAGGRFLGPAELERRPLLYMTDALRLTPNLRVYPARGFGYVVRGRGDCVPSVYLDGTLVFNGADDLDQIVPPSQVLAVEIYGSAATPPPEFGGLSGGGCGTVVIWTKR
ncbi:TonB-dependent receptor, partial [Roseisolibacter sp. H3M3-2]|uniref:carboxypeptidase-like regulatory domain-containing protein n=1 Tax=Roseisolibacter sp. H3M3-2 TaxID=3031323 RepID=UPI0023DA9430